MLNGNDAASVDVDKVHPVDAHIGCSTLSEAVGIKVRGYLPMLGSSSAFPRRCWTVFLGV
jgi:hypothetical protein